MAESRFERGEPMPRGMPPPLQGAGLGTCCPEGVSLARVEDLAPAGQGAAWWLPESLLSERVIGL